MITIGTLIARQKDVTNFWNDMSLWKKNNNDSNSINAFNLEVT
jgi:hypothetical protein